MNMPCLLKVACKMAIGKFAALYNALHETPIYSPMLFDGDTKGIEGELKAAKTEDEQPEVLVASCLHTVMAKGFRERFIESGIHEGVTSEAALARMPGSCTASW